MHHPSFTFTMEDEVDAAPVHHKWKNGRTFIQTFVVNCHIPSRRYFPVGYGQLGCSGFVVVDERGCFVSRKTMAYLQYGEAAFTYVENLLERVFDVRPMYRSSTADAVPAFMMVGREEQEKKEEKEEELDMGAPVPS
eukprot:14165294-Ditylum_brightwellii.AAC.1